MLVSEQLEELEDRVSACAARLGRGGAQGLEAFTGAQGAKKLARLGDEVRRGHSRLSVDEDSGRLVRVVDVVRLRIRDVDKGVVLLELTETVPASPTSAPFGRLPSVKRTQHEPPEEAARRLLRELTRHDSNVVLLGRSRETFEEQRESPSYLGLLTVYRTDLLEAEVATGATAAQRARIGLADEPTQEWTVQDEMGRRRRLTWRRLAEAEAQGARLTRRALEALALASDSEAAKLAPVTLASLQEKAAIAERVTALSRRVDGVYARDKRLLDLERGLAQLDGWLHVEQASAASVLQRSMARRRYVAEHAAPLREFARTLRDVEALEQYVNPPAMREMLKHGDRLRRVEASSAVAASAAMQLHDQVAKVAEEYYQAMTGLDAQILHWNQLLGSTA